MKVEKAAAQDLRGIAANTVRDLALGLRLALLRMENFEPGQGKDAARELAEQLSASARRAVELYYLESLTQAVAISEGPLQVRRKSELELLDDDETMEIQRLKSDVTGCYNRLGFTLLLQCELERARRRKVPLSLAIFKLDPADEKLVREVAKQGRECCRLLDVLGMFGNRAVAMLLPDTGPEGTQVAAQRVLSSYLSARELDGDAGSERLLVGVASHPDDGSDSDELLAKADERAGGLSLLEETLEVA
ncbi:MAG: diguanylate cyclase [Gemmatimonadota bacterium]|nr:MAG: diguanylate cyclase [Gemmatimonadota bacterium]